MKPDAIHIYTNLKRLKSCKTIGNLEKLPFWNTLLRMEHARCLVSHECSDYSKLKE